MNNTSFEVKHRNIAKIICCPNCLGEIVYENLLVINDIPATASLFCAKCNHIGDLSFFKYDFIRLNPSGLYKGAALHGRAAIKDVELRPEYFYPRLHWGKNGNAYFSQVAGDRFFFETEAISVELSLLRHSWSGIATITVNGRLLSEIDLHEPTGSVKASYSVYLGGNRNFVEIENTGRKNDASISTQVWILGIHELVVDDTMPSALVYAPRNDGNPYPAAMAKILATLPGDAVVLDCGSGDRCYDDPRVINFEYTHFFAPDVFGDGHHLPFKDNSFDFILSQAVIEHLYDPFQAVREMLRVLKPGGLVYCESAFMQPLHAVPYHYFNTTVWGIEELFKDFERVETGCEGNIANTVEWMYRLTQLREKGHGEKIDTILTLAKELDADITANELRQFASFITYMGKKPQSENALAVK